MDSEYLRRIRAILSMMDRYYDDDGVHFGRMNTDLSIDLKNMNQSGVTDD